ncbi:hypothetical protein CDAR_200371 [Caerostris darwini]|uniref:Reverse transcriptase domain-containing protein n=1 Tax=Caerostris darwini TaxID=1538125 RepID=A0AAV4MFU2_9ARAC|nr:hypothetical protein CDAR_200371 [Caerostris darwini]
MYADDTAIITHHKNLNSIANFLQDFTTHLETWLKLWKYRPQQNPTSRNKSTTSQQKKKNESDTEGFHKVPKHLKFKKPKGDTSVSNPSISFPTNPQPTDFPEDPAPPAPLARRPWIPPFFVLAKND